MSSTFRAARQEMFNMLKAVWPAASTTAVGYAVEVREQGIEVATKPPVDKHWIRLSTKNVEDIPTAFVMASAPSKSAKVSTAYGLLFVEVYGSKTAANGFDEAGALAEIAKGVYQNKESATGTWFRRVVVKELDQDGKEWRFNVVAEYEYDQLKA